ncbi:MAG: excinuclease ABC subunit UvrA [Bacteroidales bacterium]|nr:excinuclease ABC subunit UvrA [Bacteroidales bacterium]
MKKNADSIAVYGARVHNLKNIDVQIPRYSLTVITGLSGSGKSSLAFDTIYAEGQRRYIETFSAYARNFLGNLERPDVDEISGLSPVISIEQKTTNKNPRSTVGTQTEVYDYIRLLYARAGEAYSYLTGKKMVKYTEEQVLELILQDYRGRGVYLLAPSVRGRKGHYQELFESLRKKGYLNVRVDGELREIEPAMRLDRYKTHDIEIVIDKLVVGDKESQRLRKSIQTAMRAGDGLIMLMDRQSGEIRHYSRQLMCADTGLSYPDPAPHHFSFNSPQGACPRCKGLGQIRQVDLDKVIPDQRLSIAEGAIAPLGKYKNSMFFWQVEALLKRHGFTLKTPVKNLSQDCLDEILNGTDDPLVIKNPSLGLDKYTVCYEGVFRYVEMTQESDSSASAQRWANQYVSVKTCPECQGRRLKKESLCFKLYDKDIAQLAQMDIRELYEWFQALPAHLNDKQQHIAAEIVKEIQTRLGFLLDVGLDYLSLNRSSASLSGGESQRIRLATQIGSQLINVLYILDEPSIGLHYRDNMRLINSLKALRDKGNTVIVVEHDRDMMLASDYIVDLGPRAGRLGGNLVFAGTPQQLMQADTLTARYLRGEIEIPLPAALRPGNGHAITLKGCRGNNLKNIDVSFPLGKLIVVTGVSGSGKSSLVNGTLQAALNQHFYRSLQEPLPFDAIEGVAHIDKIVTVDQSPLGRSPRSNPATYCGVFTDIRNLFASLPESRIRAYRPGRFSFNMAGGRCEKCMGNGYQTIEMNFLPDVTVPCDECRGKRYNRETLEVRFKGKSIADILDMTINIAVEFFDNQPQIIRKIKTIQEVGLGYVKLGQPSSQLSGGESQRIKLAAELAKKDTGNTLYVLDEPTTGLHFDDIRVLMTVIDRLVDKGNTVIIIEHNADVIKLADHIIDMGPDGGRKGGQVVCCGTPREVARCHESFTAQCLQELFPD